MSCTLSILLYAFNPRDEVLLLHRTRQPNLGLWSPCGGKLDLQQGESPYQCACREAAEEIQLSIQPPQLHLAGVVTERTHGRSDHWLMFLFEIKTQLLRLPPPHPEGSFQFFTRQALDHLPLPQTDREQIWPLFWKHRGGFFAAHCQISPAGHHHWDIEETLPLPA